MTVCKTLLKLVTDRKSGYFSPSKWFFASNLRLVVRIPNPLSISVGETNWEILGNYGNH